MAATADERAQRCAGVCACAHTHMCTSTVTTTLYPSNQDLAAPPTPSLHPLLSNFPHVIMLHSLAGITHRGSKTCELRRVLVSLHAMISSFYVHTVALALAGRHHRSSDTCRGRDPKAVEEVQAVRQCMRPNCTIGMRERMNGASTLAHAHERPCMNTGHACMYTLGRSSARWSDVVRVLVRGDMVCVCACRGPAAFRL